MLDEVVLLIMEHVTDPRCLVGVCRDWTRLFYTTHFWDTVQVSLNTKNFESVVSVLQNLPQTTHRTLKIRFNHEQLLVGLLKRVTNYTSLDLSTHYFTGSKFIYYVRHDLRELVLQMNITEWSIENYTRFPCWSRCPSHTRWTC